MANKEPLQILDFERPIAELDSKIAELVEFARSSGMDLSDQVVELRRRLDELVKEIFATLTPWQRVLLARHPRRPLFEDLQPKLVLDWVELHGDRYFRDDPSVATGFGRIGGIKALIVAHRKGRSTRERVTCNFGSAHPEGYRKALRKMKLAEKLRLPIVTFINTPGAYPGIGAEERGQAHAIAENLLEMSRFRVPIVCIVLGEGGSGGALGIGVGDRLLMLEHAYYSVISPEGCAAILWKSGNEAARASEILKLTAQDLFRFGVIHEIIPEPLGGAHRDPVAMTETLKQAIVRNLEALRSLPADQLLAERYEHLRRIGAWVEERYEEAAPEAAAPPPRAAESSEIPAKPR